MADWLGVGEGGGGLRVKLKKGGGGLQLEGEEPKAQSWKWLADMACFAAAGGIYYLAGTASSCYAVTCEVVRVAV